MHDRFEYLVQPGDIDLAPAKRDDLVITEHMAYFGAELTSTTENQNTHALLPTITLGLHHSTYPTISS